MTTDIDTELEQARAAVLAHGYAANEYPLTFELHGDPAMEAALRRFERAVRRHELAVLERDHGLNDFIVYTRRNELEGQP